jgi:ABC-type proline/glycine betaine transport system substrate-binding protein
MGRRRENVTMRKTLATVVAAGMMLVPAAGAAQQEQDGLVNVAIGDITLEDINVGVAANVAATVCGVKVGPVVILATQVDATGNERTVCETAAGPVTLRQN